MVETICHCHCAVNRLKPFFTRFNSFYELLSLRCRRRNPIVTADALFFLSFVLSFFLSFFFIPLSNEIYTLFSFVETRAIDLKIEHNVQNGLISHSNSSFWKSDLR